MVDMEEKEEKEETEPSDRFERRGRRVHIESGRWPNTSRYCVLATSTGLRLLWSKQVRCVSNIMTLRDDNHLLTIFYF